MMAAYVLGLCFLFISVVGKINYYLDLTLFIFFLEILRDKCVHF